LWFKSAIGADCAAVSEIVAVHATLEWYPRNDTRHSPTHTWVQTWFGMLE
jgi:hypothetical protein